jgi:adenine-specific DNA-methyltransferase
MNTVFVGGSRRVSRLPSLARERLDNVVASGFPIVVGDANGADKAVQKHLFESGYQSVTIFCSGETCRTTLATGRRNSFTYQSTRGVFSFMPPRIGKWRG